MHSKNNYIHMEINRLYPVLWETAYYQTNQWKMVLLYCVHKWLVTYNAVCCVDFQNS